MSFRPPLVIFLCCSLMLNFTPLIILISGQNPRILAGRREASEDCLYSKISFLFMLSWAKKGRENTKDEVRRMTGKGRNENGEKDGYTKKTNFCWRYRSRRIASKDNRRSATKCRGNITID